MKRGAFLLLGATLVAGTQAQQSRPYVGNPLQTLPTPVPMAPKNCSNGVPLKGFWSPLSGVSPGLSFMVTTVRG